MFEIFNSILKPLVRITFIGLTNANRSILTIKTMNALIKTLNVAVVGLWYFLWFSTYTSHSIRIKVKSFMS